MAMSDIATMVFQYAVTPAIVVGGIGWLIKILVVEALNRERERIKSNIERDSALAIEQIRNASLKEIERIRHGYNQELEEKKVRFARLQDKRVDPLVQLYADLAELASAAEYLKTILHHKIDSNIAADMERFEELVRSANNSFAKTRIL